LATTANNICRLWSIAGPDDQVTLKHEFQDARFAHFIGDGHRIAVTSSEGVLRVYDTRTGRKQELEISRVNYGFAGPPRISPRGRFVVAVTKADDESHAHADVWNLESLTTCFKLESGSVGSLFDGDYRFSPNEDRLLLYDRLIELPTGRTVAPEINHGDSGYNRQTTFSPRGELLITQTERFLDGEQELTESLSEFGMFDPFDDAFGLVATDDGAEGGEAGLELGQEHVLVRLLRFCADGGQAVAGQREMG
jgi:hypothetical protein